MRSHLIFILLLLTLLVGAQNLIPNPSFEEYIQLPRKTYNGIGCLKYWRPHNGNCDYYHAGAGWWTGVPRNVFGRQRAHSGLAYAGICVTSHFKEYLEVKLIEPLVKGQTYSIELYVSEAERFSGHVEAVGLYFKATSCWSNDNSALTETPALTFKISAHDKPQKKWLCLTAEYQAEGFEKVLIIGYYQDPTLRPHKGYSHLYIDDVSITPQVTLGHKKNAEQLLEWNRMRYAFVHNRSKVMARI